MVNKISGYIGGQLSREVKSRRGHGAGGRIVVKSPTARGMHFARQM